MVKRIGTARRKTRKSLRKSVRERGKISISRFFQTFEIGDKVMIDPEPAVHTGLPFRRFVGKTGTVCGKQGSCYCIEIKNGKKQKVVIAHPVHLKLAKLK